VSRKKLTYLQYSDKSAQSEMSSGDVMSSVTPAAYKVMPYDNLYIRVITPDPQWSSLFNTDVGTAGITQESAALSGYTVDVNGSIEIPYVGKLSVAGKTLSEIKTELDSVFKNYVTDAAITVRLVNNFVTLIGEVRLPGRFLLTKDRITIFDALSLAGDISDYGNRQRVQLIRPSPYGPVIKEFSLADRSILASELYYIMPNDIIYAMPRQRKAFQVNSSVWKLFLTTITSAMGIIAFFRTL
jgi:polysaccharide export outer membrane protein